MCTGLQDADTSTYFNVAHGEIVECLISLVWITFEQNFIVMACYRNRYQHRHTEYCGVGENLQHCFTTKIHNVNHHCFGNISKVSVLKEISMWDCPIWFYHVLRCCLTYGADLSDTKQVIYNLNRALLIFTYKFEKENGSGKASLHVVLKVLKVSQLITALTLPYVSALLQR